jgi:hypothetical protein
MCAPGKVAAGHLSATRRTGEFQAELEDVIDAGVRDDCGQRAVRCSRAGAGVSVGVVARDSPRYVGGMGSF